VRVDVGQTVFGRLQLFAPDVFSAMQNLSLQIAVIDDVEINQSQPSDAAAARYKPSGEPSPPAPIKSTLAAFSLR